MTRETYVCQHCGWQYRSPVRLSEPPLHLCPVRGKCILVPTKPAPTEV